MTRWRSIRVSRSTSERADVISIGTNDLVQYTLAADRTNAELADLAVGHQLAILRLIDIVVRGGRARGRHVPVCGEAASDPSLVPLLVGLGVEELSVTSSSVATIRSFVGGLDVQQCRQLATRALAAATVAQVRAIAAEAAPLRVGA